MSRTPSRTPTITNTPTITRTPTLTPTPDCSLISITAMSISGDRVNATARNNNPIAVTLTSTTLVWTASYPNQYVNYFSFRGNQYYGGNDYDSPTSASSSVTAPVGNSAWQADFNNVPGGMGLDGTFTVTLTFDGRCTVSRSVTRDAPTATATRTATATATRTQTPTITRTPTRTLTPTITWTPSITPTPSRTPTRTMTPTRTNTPTRTMTPTRTYTPTITFTPSVTPTRTPSRTPTVGPTRTNTPSPVPTATATAFCMDC